MTGGSSSLIGRGQENGGFTHLEVHSSLTLLGGTAPVAALAARAATEGMSHLALTDTNALYGAVAFDRTCRAVGVEPILGMTVTVAQPGESLGAATVPGRLVLLAMDPAGYRSLCRLSSLIQAHPEREALAAQGLTWEDLEAHHEGLICLSGGRAGWIERHLRAGDYKAAVRYAAHLTEIYGDRTYVHLELHPADDLAIARELIALGGRFGLRPVAVQPVYCLSADDAPRLRLLAAIDPQFRSTQCLPRLCRPAAARQRSPLAQPGDRGPLCRSARAVKWRDNRVLRRRCPMAGRSGRS